MIYFIIYEDNKEFRKLYVSEILKIAISKNIAYKIIELDKYDEKNIQSINKIDGYKIFLLDVEVPGKSGIDIAKLVRNSGDWDSQIIIATTHEKLLLSALSSRLLILDYISKYINCIERVNECINQALDIFNCKKALIFQYNGEVHQIPYKDILFIEKNSDSNNSIINTKTKKIEINKTISDLEEILKDDRFIKTHRSCIVNINNITSFELNTSTVRFNDKETKLVSRENKKILKEKLTNNEQYI